MKLSVLMITYNHEKYLAQALDSVLMQQVDFPYEIVVGEDGSTDKTPEIVRAYQRRFPEKIRVVNSDTNVGMHQNFIRTYRACRGDYIALLEGDDYWTSPNKLQLQVDFLERNSGYATCFHGIETLDQSSGEITGSARAADSNATFTLDDLIVNNMVPTCSAVFRNRLILEFPEWLFLLKQMDWPIHIMNSRYGNLKYLDHVMAVYRIHSAGVWNQHSEEERLRAIVYAFDVLKENLEEKFRTALTVRQSLYRLSLLNLCLATGDLGPAASVLSLLRESADDQLRKSLWLPSLKLKLNRPYRLLCKLTGSLRAAKERLLLR